MRISLPPEKRPSVGVTCRITGAARYVKARCVTLEPNTLEWTCTEHCRPLWPIDGLKALVVAMIICPLQVTALAGWPHTFTVIFSFRRQRFSPLIANLVPPMCAPLSGCTSTMRGARLYSYACFTLVEPLECEITSTSPEPGSLSESMVPVSTTILLAAAERTFATGTPLRDTLAMSFIPPLSSAVPVMVTVS